MLMLLRSNGHRNIMSRMMVCLTSVIYLIGTGNIYVATGFSGNGITYGIVSAIVLRDLILNGKNEYTELFNPNRIKPIAGFAKFVKENLDVAKELIEKILPSEKLEELAGLANGEGKVVKFEGQNIALCKDDNGNCMRLILHVRI